MTFFKRPISKRNLCSHLRVAFVQYLHDGIVMPLALWSKPFWFGVKIHPHLGVIGLLQFRLCPSPYGVFFVCTGSLLGLLPGLPDQSWILINFLHASYSDNAVAFSYWPTSYTQLTFPFQCHYGERADDLNTWVEGDCFVSFGPGSQPSCQAVCLSSHVAFIRELSWADDRPSGSPAKYKQPNALPIAILLPFPPFTFWILAPCLQWPATTMKDL